MVDTLAAEIKAKNSAFYTGSTGVSGELAARVVAGFAINSVPDPKAVGASGPSAGLSSASKQAKVRQDAIIGVVTTLGAIAIIILLVLAFRSLSRRRELAHRRLSEPPGGAYIGARPSGQDFDQD